MSHIPSGTSTYSKDPSRFPDSYPQRIVSGSDAFVHDERGRLLIDWTGALGANLYGHDHPDIKCAILCQLENGITFPFPHPIEEEVAALFCEITGFENVRFCKNGSDATEAAVRLARFVTKREMILTFGGYHGYHSDLIGSTPGKRGGILTGTIQALRKTTPDNPYLAADLHHVACLIAEPYPNIDWHRIADACHNAGCLLIFDQLITGFRPGLSVTDVEPDLACYGKALANGMPLACVAGPRWLMQHYEQDVFFSGTANTECLSLAAAKASLTLYQNADHAQFLRVGGVIVDCLQHLMNKHDAITCDYLYPARCRLQYRTPEIRAAILTGMLDRGHLIGHDIFPTFAHTLEHAQQFAQDLTAVVESLGPKEATR